MNGIDISFAQGTIDWDKVKGSGKVDFAYARASYGTNPADDDGTIFQRNHDECKRVGIPFGCYHFFLFGQDGAAQAAHFLQQIDGRYGDLRAMVNVEEESGFGASLEQQIENLAAFNTAIEKALDVPAIIYTNSDTWDGRMASTDAFAGHTLWQAAYNADAMPPSLSGFPKTSLWQYTSGGVIPGINGFVNLDRLLVDIADIKR